MSASTYTLTRDELNTTIDAYPSTFGYPNIFWLCEDRGTGDYELIPDAPLCHDCYRSHGVPEEVDDTHAFMIESASEYEPGETFCGNCGIDVTES